jgi:hypothetical protein
VLNMSKNSSPFTLRADQSVLSRIYWVYREEVAFLRNKHCLGCVGMFTSEAQ